MIAISALVEGGAVVTGLCILFVGAENIALAQAIAYGLCAAVVAFIMSNFLANRGVRSFEVWFWRDGVSPQTETKLWWSGDRKHRGRFAVSMTVGVLAGLTLGLLARGYSALLLWFPAIAEMIQTSGQQMAKLPDLNL